MTAAEMSDRIVEMIERNGDVTFATIFNALGEEAKGEFSWEPRPNVVLWTGMSQTLIDTLEGLMRDRIELRPSHWLCYFFDGAALRLPLAKSPSLRGYKKPHWLPVAFTMQKQTSRADVKARPKKNIGLVRHSKEKSV